MATTDVDDAGPKFVPVIVTDWPPLVEELAPETLSIVGPAYLIVFSENIEVVLLPATDTI